MTRNQDGGESLDGGDSPKRGERDPSPDEVLRLRAENESLRVQLSRRRSNRRWLAGFLVVLAVVAMTASALSIWTRATLYDTERFMAVVEPAFDDPAFSAAMRNYVADASLEALDLDARVAAVLEELDLYLSEALVNAIDPDPELLARLQAFDRPTLSALSPAMSGALEARVITVVDRFITSDEVRTRLPDLVRDAHTGGVALITDDLDALDNVYLEAGEVRLDLTPVIIEALQEVTTELEAFVPDVTLPTIVVGRTQQSRERVRNELATSLQVRLPDDFGQLTLMSESSLSHVQQAARQADRLVWAIALLACVLLASAIAVSPDRRRTSIQLALGVAATLGGILLLVPRIEAAFLEQITDPDGELAVRSLLQEVATDLRTVTLALAVLAIAAAFTAHLLGRPAWVTGLGRGRSGLRAPNDAGNRLDRWIAARFDGLRIVGFAVALGVVVLTAVGPLPLLLIGGLLVLYLETIAAAQRRITSRELASPVPARDGNDPPPAARTATMRPSTIDDQLP